MHLLDHRWNSSLSASTHKCATQLRTPGSTLQVPLDSTLAQIEKGAILGGPDRMDGNEHMAARMLGIGVKILSHRLA